MSGRDVEEGTYRDGDKYNQAGYTRLVNLFPQNHAYHEPGNCYDCCVVKFASERIHDLISEENGLRHNRITWFANIEGFLWLSFAAVISNEVGWKYGFWLMLIIPAIGICVCLSAITAIWDADAAVKLLLKKWRTIQDHQPKSPYAVIPVLGLSYEELAKERIFSIPRWHFALFVLVGWIFGLVFVLVTKFGSRPSGDANWLATLMAFCPRQVYCWLYNCDPLEHDQDYYHDSLGQDQDYYDSLGNDY